MRLARGWTRYSLTHPRNLALSWLCVLVLPKINSACLMSVRMMNASRGCDEESRDDVHFWLSAFSGSGCSAGCVAQCSDAPPVDLYTQPETRPWRPPFLGVTPWADPAFWVRNAFCAKQPLVFMCCSLCSVGQFYVELKKKLFTQCRRCSFLVTRSCGRRC